MPVQNISNSDDLAQVRFPYPVPWYTQGQNALPRNFKLALEYSEFLWYRNTTLRQAWLRIISYFIEDIIVSAPENDANLGDDERRSYQRMLEEVLDVKNFVMEVNKHKVAYGNVFISFVFPLRRMLICQNQKCGIHTPIQLLMEDDSVRFEYDPQKVEFKGTCPKCKKRGVFRVLNLPDDFDNKLRLKIWDPKSIEIGYDKYSGEKQYFWKIDEDYKSRIRKGDTLALKNAPLPVLRAIASDQLFRFAPEAIFHLCQETLSGIQSEGWGIPDLLTSYGDVWYDACLRRINEAVGLDYIVPFRVLSPTPQTGGKAAGGTDIYVTKDMSEFNTEAARMLSARRRDPGHIQIMSHPVTYQMLGGEANRLATPALLQESEDRILNGIGLPANMYRGDLSAQVAPVMLRMFENIFRDMVSDNNKLLRWIASHLSRLMGWQGVEVKFRSVRLADDLNKQMTQLQMAVGGQASLSRAFESVGLDYRDETRRKYDDLKYDIKMKKQFEEEMEQAQLADELAGNPIMQSMQGGAMQGGAMPPGGAMPGGAMPPGGGAMPPGGMPPGGGGGMVDAMLSNTAGDTPSDLLEKGRQLAMQLADPNIPQAQRTSEMTDLKHKNPALHGIVKQQLEDIRREAALQGRDMVLSQQLGQ